MSVGLEAATAGPRRVEPVVCLRKAHSQKARRAIRLRFGYNPFVSYDSLPVEIAPAEVRRLLDSGEPVYLIDVRQPEEHALCHIEGAQLIPMNTVPAALQDLETKADDATLVVFCHHGMRSLNVVNWLRGQGIAECTSMSGGIDQWSTEIDPDVPRY